MSQNSWNADYNSAKGALLVGNATRPVVVPVGANGSVLTADSTQTSGVKWNTSSGIIVQQVRATASGTFSTAASNYVNFAVPTNAQGASVISATITPTSAANILIFDFSTYVFTSPATNCAVALHQGAIVNAIYTQAAEGLQIEPLCFKYYQVAGTTAATTFTIRGSSFGPGVVTMYLNGLPGGQIAGGSEKIIFTITEVTP